MSRLISSFCAFASVILAGAASSAQDLDIEDLLGTGGGFGPKVAEVSAELVAGRLEVGAVAYLRIHVLLPLDHYIYSLNPDFSGGTAIEVSKIEGLEPIDAGFKPTRKPKVVFEKFLKQNVEKFFDEITWVQRFRVTDPRAAEVSGQLTGQFCTAGKDGQGGNCTQISPPAEFNASLKIDEALSQAPDEAASGPVFDYREQPTRGANAKPDPLALRFRLTPADPDVGDEVTLQITMTLEDGWHTFSQSQNPEHTGLPTKIKVTEIAGLSPLEGGFTADHKPESADPFNDGKEQSLFHGEVTWSRRYKVTAEESAIAGSIEYQACKNACLAPKAIDFALGTPLLTMTAVPAAESGLYVASASDADGGDEFSDEPANLPVAILFAFLGGLILNVMPCVLPVLAIKVLSFVKQAGEKRSRIFVLNVAYAVGVISVFLILASLAVTLKFGWGDLFQHSAFNIAMAAMIFAMALSLLGIFEIPIPGIGGGQSKEGAFGAFLTGIFATILATPCSGPFLGPTLIWSVKQPTEVTYLVWGVMGLGMASPYLLFAIFPAAVKLLPKPGMWMVRFKEIAGFILLLTVIYFFYVLEDRFAVPLLLGLLALGIGLWMVGQLYQHNSPASTKWRIRILALAVCVGGFFAARYFTEPPPPEGVMANELAIVDDGKTLPWQRFSEERLFAMLYQKKTVMIDFTADWCQSCKLNEQVALNTAETLELVKEHDIVPLYADKTRTTKEIEKYLARFKSISIPLTVILPNGDLNNPIILRDTITQGTMIKAIKKAVGANKVAQAD